VSDTAESRAPKGRGCCCKLVVAVGLAVLAVGGYGVWAVNAVQADAPLPFEPFEFRPLERPALQAAIELKSLPQRLLTGGAARVELSERQLNGLLFGDAGQTDDQKARVLIDQGRLRVEASQAIEGKPGQYANVVATIRLDFGPEAAVVHVDQARVGSYELGPVTKPLLESRLNAALAEQRETDPDLRRIKEIEVGDDSVEVLLSE